jgi:virulence-associated protein VagC
VGKSVVLEPLTDDAETWLAELKKIPADPDFMKERKQPKTPKREIFK